MENKPITVGVPPIPLENETESENLVEKIFPFLKDDENDPLYPFTDEELDLPELEEAAKRAIKFIERQRRLRWIEEAREEEIRYKARRAARRACMQSLSDAEVRNHPALKVANFRGLEGKVEDLPRDQLVEIILDYELDEPEELE